MIQRYSSCNIFSKPRRLANYPLVFCYRESPDGVLALAKLPKWRIEDISFKNPPFILILNALEKPGNIGALLRTADSVGVDAVILSGDGADLYNPNVIRASMGSLFALPVLEITACELLSWLKIQNIKVVAASPEAEKLYWDQDASQGIAIVLGTEHAGLDNFWSKKADEWLKIPMQGSADSLNVATSGALILYEVLRQRRTKLD
ncbi:MAG: RNA methyltransferase [Deinococcales bacterium]